MKYKELKEKKNVDLPKLLSEKKEELRAHRSNVSGAKKRNVKEAKALRKDIARILTLVNEKKA